MKKIFVLLVYLIAFTSLIIASEKKALVEIFTNSHCPVCPAAHSALDSYLQSANGEKIEFIYYHIRSPYSDDNLYQHNISDADTKSSLYNAPSSPTAFFDGVKVSNSYNNWSSSLDAIVAGQSSFDIVLSGNYSETEFTISADVTKAGDNSVSDLIINYIVVENLVYAGRNGIINHKNVMRKIVNPQGDAFTITLNETKNLSSTIVKNSAWNTNNLNVIVSVQSKSTKEILQSSSISYSEFVVTSVENENIISNSFKLEQNYPNPFNPSTTINYLLPTNGVNNSFQVQLIVYDMLGNEMAILVNEQQSSGEHQVTFNAPKLSNGVYYYQLKAGNLIQTKKMILLK